MVDYSQIGALDRSRFFRYKSDYVFLRKYLEEKIRVVGSSDWKPIETLVVGVGNLEEPLSIMATCGQVAKNWSAKETVGMKDVLKLDFVDIRGRDELKPRYSLGTGYGNAINPVPAIFFDGADKSVVMSHPLTPQFVKDYPEGFEFRNGEYCFTREVIGAVSEAVRCGKFSTPVQTFLAENKGQYPLIFFNNVVTHLGVEGGRVALDLTIKLLKRDGVLFSHNSSDVLDSKGVRGSNILFTESGRFPHLQRVAPAVYRKIT